MMNEEEIIFGVLRRGKEHVSVVVDMEDPQELYNALLNAVMSSEVAGKVLADVVLAMLGTIGMSDEDVLEWMHECAESVSERRPSAACIAVPASRVKS